MDKEVFTGERFIPGIDDRKLEIEHMQRYISFCELVVGKDVLDAACGEGYGSKILSETAKTVIGLDISEDTIIRANKNYAEKTDNLSYVCGSIAKMDMIPDHSKDVVISFETIEHVPEDVQNAFLNEIKRILRKGGLLVMSTPNKRIYSDLYHQKNHFHIKEFYQEEFVSFIHKQFKNVQLFSQSFEVACILDSMDHPRQSLNTYDSARAKEAKYVIAIASDEEIPNIYGTAVTICETGEYDAIMHRIVQLQKEEEDRNNHLKKLDKEIEQYRDRIINDDAKIETLRNKVQNSEIRYENLQLEYQEKVQKYQVLLNNKEGHIEQLLEVERAYEREKNSRTYRLANKFRQISLFLCPPNSVRRFFAKVIVKSVRHPKMMLKMINPRRIKNAILVLKREGAASATNHMKLVEEFERSNENPVELLHLATETEERKNIEEYPQLVFPEYDHPQVSIVIPVYNQFDYTYHCLESILNYSGDCTYEVIVANDNSNDLTTQIHEVIHGIHVVTNEENKRFLLNCNNAAKYAQGQYILFLNNDTQVQENWLQPLIDVMEHDDSVGMVGSKLVYADGFLQEAGGILWQDASAWNYGNRQNPNDSEFNYVHEADYISGAAIMIRTNLWEKIGGFDERYVPAYCEDSDLAFEVRKHGYKVMYQPLSVVVHFEGISNGTDLSSGQKKYQVENQKKFYEKWKKELNAEHFENGTDVFLARDRSTKKKHILVIDHYVPQYDKDAGSKTTFMYLKMFVKKGYQVTFLGDNFYQHEPYTTELQQLGICVLYGQKYAQNWKIWLEENAKYFDIFYLNRPHISVKYIDIIRNCAKGKVIYYGHDLHFLRIKREYELNGDASLLKESNEWLEKELYLMHKADMSYYPSDVEIEAIHEIDPAIKAKAITAYVYEQFPKIRYNTNQREGLLFVGGFGHAPNLDAVKWFLNKIYPEIYKRTGAKFYIVGSNAPKEIQNLSIEGVVVKGFVTEEELHQLYQNTRIDVVPLRYGAGVKGKVVEGLHYGMPIVTTSVGAEGITGVEQVVAVADEEQKMIDIICELYTNGDKLKEMSEESCLFIQKHFSIDSVWNVIKDDFS